jgi:hypothetical protein
VYYVGRMTGHARQGSVMGIQISCGRKKMILGSWTSSG